MNNLKDVLDSFKNPFDRVKGKDYKTQIILLQEMGYMPLECSVGGDTISIFESQDGSWNKGRLALVKGGGIIRFGDDIVVDEIHPILSSTMLVIGFGIKKGKKYYLFGNDGSIHISHKVLNIINLLDSDGGFNDYDEVVEAAKFVFNPSNDGTIEKTNLPSLDHNHLYSKAYI